MATAPTATRSPRPATRRPRSRRAGHRAAAGEQLQPLRGAAGRIAENMAASVSIPLATSQRTIAVKVMDENRRVINQHRSIARQEQSLLHAHHRLGHRQSAGANSRR